MQQFLPSYPFLGKIPIRDFLDIISSKREFQIDYMKEGTLLPHQIFIKRFISPYTCYDNLLLFHEMGSGKTFSSISVAETLMDDVNSGIKKTIVIVRGMGLRHNFVNELVNKCTDGKYIHEKKNLWKTRYEFWSMEVFGKHLSSYSDRELIRKYNNRLFIIDEAHHLKKKKIGPYNAIHNLLHILPHRKLLVLTGTPMKDDVSEFANSANLMLTLEDQLPHGLDFNATYFQENNLIGRDILCEKLGGMVSFYKGSGPKVQKKFLGVVKSPMNHIPLVYCPMSEFQAKTYKRALEMDMVDGAVYINSRQAGLFVFPDGSYGKHGFQKYMIVTKKKTLTGDIHISYTLTDGLKKEITDNHIGKFSSKFKHILDIVTSTALPKTFIYSEFVNGSGAILLSQIFKLFGYKQATGKETVPGKRFILATTQTLSTNIVKLIDKFNSPANRNGELIQVFIGSQIISEGYSLKDVTHEFILTPHWNLSETEQIIARCWRINSHNNENAELKISLLSVDMKKTPTTDIYMYKTSEEKDHKIKQMERLLKEISVDCNNYRPNLSFVENSRDCDYTTCNIKCIGTPSEREQSSYDILFPDREGIETEMLLLFDVKNQVSLEEIVSTLSQSEFQILAFISDLIYSNKPIVYNDVTMFLRRIGNMLYLTEDATVSPEDILPLPKFWDQSITVTDLMNGLQSDWLFRSLKLIFEERIPLNLIIYKLPRQYQHLILTACIYANVMKTGSPVVINNILDYYKGFYQLGETNYVWLFYEEYGTVYLKQQDDEYIWLPSPVDLYQQLRDELYKSPIGFYGLYNPQLDEFCLRKIIDQEEQTDLRKVAVGRRCEDWDQSSLLDIKRALGLDIDVSKLNRAGLCRIIKETFFLKKLIMYNFDCGNQFKIRGRI